MAAAACAWRCCLSRSAIAAGELPRCPRLDGEPQLGAEMLLQRRLQPVLVRPVEQMLVRLRDPQLDAAARAPPARNAAPACAPCRSGRAGRPARCQTPSVAFFFDSGAAGRRRASSRARWRGSASRRCDGRALRRAGANASMRSSAIVNPACSSGASPGRRGPGSRSGSRAADPRARNWPASSAHGSRSGSSVADRVRHRLRQRQAVQQRRQVLQRGVERQAALRHAPGLRHQRGAVARGQRPQDRAEMVLPDHARASRAPSPARRCRRRARSPGRAGDSASRRLPCAARASSCSAAAS